MTREVPDDPAWVRVASESVGSVGLSASSIIFSVESSRRLGPPSVGLLFQADLVGLVGYHAAELERGLQHIVVVGNTGGGAPGGLTEGGFDAVEAGFRAMLQPQLEAAQRAIPALRAGGDGRMVFLTARSILEASPDLALSSVFRSGVAAAARSLALELAPEVTVNVVVPGRFDTPALQRFEAARAAQTGRSTAEVREGHKASIPLRRLGRAEELADLVVFLVSERARYITGATFRIDGGLTRGF